MIKVHGVIFLIAVGLICVSVIYTIYTSSLRESLLPLTALYIIAAMYVDSNYSLPEPVSWVLVITAVVLSVFAFIIEVV